MQDLISHATDAMNKKDWPQAVRRWQKVFMTFKDQTPPEAYVLLSMAHRFQGQFEQAEAIIANGMKILPVNISILSEYAEIAKAKKDWPEVAKRLEVLQKANDELQIWNKQVATFQINYIGFKLHNLGFSKKATADLKLLAANPPHPMMGKLSSWHLAVWYAKNLTTANASECLKRLKAAKDTKDDPTRLRQIAVLQAECLYLLGKNESAREILVQALSQGIHADIFLALANIEKETNTKLKWVNRILQFSGLSELCLAAPDQQTNTMDFAWTSSRMNHSKVQNDGSKVSVIFTPGKDIPLIKLSIDSLVSQTWSNLEILVVDQHHKGSVSNLLHDYSCKDSRVKILHCEPDAVKYAARNLALQHASGDFVTCLKENEWLHPQKIESQALQFAQHPKVIASIAQQAKITHENRFYMHGQPGSYISHECSTLMFRRKPVSRYIGYWDSVQHGACKEFLNRINKLFGKKSIIQSKKSILSVLFNYNPCQHGNRFVGQGYIMTPEHEYLESSKFFIDNKKNLYYSSDSKTRQFPAPYTIVKNDKSKQNLRRHFDVIIASQFTITGGGNFSIKEEIMCQRKIGLKTGLVQLYHYDYPNENGFRNEIRECIDGESVQVITYNEKVSCDLLIIRYPPVLEERQDFVPDIDAKDIRIIVNIPPKRTYEHNGEVRYTINKCHRHLLEYFGKPGTWHPIGPLVRQALIHHHSKDLDTIPMSDEDWINIIDVDHWKRPCRPVRGSKIRIGRHSRDHYVKWPKNPQELLLLYPESDACEVHVLGGASTPRAILGRLPGNWKVHEYGTMPPKEFLSNLDVYVHFTHPDWVESFGRSVIEAMAVGVPVIMPHEYKVLFGDAAIYAQPADVYSCIKNIMNNEDYYENVVQNARSYVESFFGYSQHISRLKRISTDLSTKIRSAKENNSLMN